MTATACAAEGLLAVELQADAEQVQQAEPHAEAPRQADQQSDVDVPAVSPLGLGRNSVTVLSTIVGVQAAWLAALAYGFFRFVL